MTIAPYPKADLLPGETLALGTLRTSFRRYGESVVIASLKMLRRIDAAGGLPASAIMGTCDAVKAHPEWLPRTEQIAAALEERGLKIAVLAEKARARKVSRGGTEWSNFRAIIEMMVVTGQQTAGVPLKRLMAGR